MIRLALAALLICFSANLKAQSRPLQLFLSIPWSLGIHVAEWALKDNEKTFYVEVTADGRNLEEARQSAFRIAVERAVGFTILSETETTNSKIRRDEIITYASGFVNDYKIVDQTMRWDRVWIKAQVWVKHSAIANRLIAKAENSENIDGSKIDTRIKSLNEERKRGVQSISTILNDYPHRAYEITKQNHRVVYNGQSADLIIDFEIRMAYTWVYAMYETLSKISQRSSGCDYRRCGAWNVSQDAPYWIILTAREPNKWLWSRWGMIFQFTEPNVINQALFQMTETTSGTAWTEKVSTLNQPAVQVEIAAEGGNIRHRSCHFYSELTGIVHHRVPDNPFFRVDHRGEGIYIFGDNALRLELDLKNVPSFKDFSKVTLSVIRTVDCPEFKRR